MQTNTLKIMLVISALLFLCNESFCQNLVQGKLTFRNGNVAKGYKIIVVPKTKSNDNITNSLYFYGDDKGQLQQMKALIAFTNDEGKYYFKSLAAGEYILKVCTINGFKYKFRIKDGNYTVLNIKNLPATY
jgi:hypothetical protein